MIIPVVFQHFLRDYHLYTAYRVSRPTPIFNSSSFLNHYTVHANGTQELNRLSGEKQNMMTHSVIHNRVDL